MWTVKITQGTWKDQIGTATPFKAYGNINCRMFTVLVTLSNGDNIELPVSAIEEVRE